MQVKKRLSLLSVSVLLLGVIATSCKKDKVLEPDPGSGTPDGQFECTDIVFTGTDIIDGYVNTGDQYTAPVFSPFSDDEFLYIKLIPPFEKQLIRYTISTNTEQVLCTTSDVGGLILGSRPDWGNQHWVVFSVGTGASSKCFKIYDDGSGLEQITPNGVDCNLPRLNSSGDRFIVMGSEVTNGNPYRPIYDLSGFIVDSILYDHGGIYSGKPYHFQGSIHDGIYAYSNQTINPNSRGVGIIESNGSLTSLFSVDSYGDIISEVCQYQNMIYFLMDRKGLYSFDTTTSQIELIREICDTRHIRNMSISQLSGNLLIEEVKRVKVDENGGVDEQSDILLLNPVTGEAKSILVE